MGKNMRYLNEERLEELLKYKPVEKEKKETVRKRLNRKQGRDLFKGKLAYRRRVGQATDDLTTETLVPPAEPKKVLETSGEIKSFIIARLQKGDPETLWQEFFDEVKKEYSVLHVKTVYSRWLCACREIGKEHPELGVDITLPKSLICCNAARNAMKTADPSLALMAMKATFGWDVNAVAYGKHCKALGTQVNIAQVTQKLRTQTS